MSEGKRAYERATKFHSVIRTQKNHAVHGFLPLAKRTEPASEFRTGETF